MSTRMSSGRSTSRRGAPTPADMGIPKLAASASKMQQSIWFYRMQLFLASTGRNEDVATAENNDSTTQMIVDSIEPEMLEKLFASDRNFLLEEPSTYKLWELVKTYIKKPSN